MLLIFLILEIMADFGDMEASTPVAVAPVAFVPEMPEIKLFGKWSLEEVQLNDMSLQVSAGVPDTLERIHNILHCRWTFVYSL